ncbi:MAG: DUF4382 domain-containing protein [Bacteroidetes bacterium]|nr:DUF4382 domain-containing protein [Bacteroidota bacterium]
MKKAIKLFVLVAGLATVFAGCSDMNTEGQADVQFRLTDMPGEYQQVNIEVLAVEVKVNDTLIEMTTNQGIFNLLEFVNGKDTLLADDLLPAGFISQIRLVLGEDNTVMIDSMLHDLKTPSAQQSGLKLQVHEEFIAGESYSYIIDFVVEKSIVNTGNGKYILKPVLRVFTEAVTGSIQGVVSPVRARPLVMALIDDDTVSTYADTISGAFMIRGLAEGSYDVEFSPVEGFRDTLISGLSVSSGQTTEMMPVFIHQVDSQ